jgi:CRP-like cAMP-binding protein
MLDASLLSGLPPFEGLSPSEITDIVGQARARRIAKDAAVFEQDEDADAFHLLLDGHVRVVKLTAAGDQVIARYISSGELLGIAVALGRPTYPASAIAAADCVVLSWPNAQWSRITTAHPAFATNTYKSIGTRLEDAQQRIIEMATARVEQRVASAVVRLAAQSGRKTDEGIVIDFPISRQDIAEMTGTTLHTVSRLMSQWEDKGWVLGGRQRVVLLEGHKLVMLAQGLA